MKPASTRPIVFCLFACGVWIANPSPAAEHAEPNIVLIVADDLGYGDVLCLNPARGRIKTPRLDEFAAQGMVFTDCHSGSSVCTPTRYGLLTGRYAWRTRLRNGVLDGFPDPLIAADRLTVAGMLRQRGYRTGAIGKWHLGFTVDAEKRAGDLAVGTRTPDGPITRGFETWAGFQHARSMRSFFEQDRVVRHVEPVDMLPLLTRLASEHIAEKARDGKPFFLYLALNSPHTPIVPSAEWQGKSGLGDYADFVMQTDWSVGRVLAAIDKAGIADRTLVIVTSDNGCSPAAGTGRLESQGHFASAQFRGYKSDIWEGGHRVPFLVRWPGRVKAGSRNDATVCLTDFPATCAEIVGARETGEDGFSLLAELLGVGKTARTSTVHHSIDGRFAIRSGPWKLVLCPGSGGWSAPKDGAATKKKLPPVQLYDLSADPGETRNLHAERPEVVKRLTDALEKIVADGRSTPGRPSANDVPVTPHRP